MRFFLIFLICCLALTTPALAAEPGTDTDGLERALPEAARDILGDLTVSDMSSGSRGVWERIVGWVLSSLGGYVGAAARSACVALAVALLCSLAGALSEKGKTSEVVVLGGALAIMAACAGDMKSFLGQTQTALLELQDFSRALLPTIAASAAAGGHGAAAAARYAASALFMDVLMAAGVQVILPVIYAYAAASTAAAALPTGTLAGPVKLTGWVCTTLLAALTTVFTLALSVTGAVAGSADKVAGSLAKSAISAALPVVGSILADAADTYVAGAAALRGAVGLFGLAGALGVCLGPALGLGLHYLMYKAAACVAEPFAEGRLAGLVNNIGTAYGMALGLVGSAGTMLFISIVISAEVVGG